MTGACDLFAGQIFRLDIITPLARSCRTNLETRPHVTFVLNSVKLSFPELTKEYKPEILLEMKHWKTTQRAVRKTEEIFVICVPGDLYHRRISSICFHSWHRCLWMKLYTAILILTKVILILKKQKFFKMIITRLLRTIKLSRLSERYFIL